MPRAETRLSEDTKRAWAKFCKDSGMSEADMLRKMIERVTGGVATSEDAEPNEPKSGKITMRFTEREQREILKRAKREGFPNRTNWATAVILASLHREPVLNDKELATLRESNRELAAIGRNLNQVARALNIEFRDSDKLKLEGIEKLAERIEHHKDLVADLLTRNMSRWGDDG